jgi:hypothetical protein
VRHGKPLWKRWGSRPGKGSRGRKGGLAQAAREAGVERTTARRRAGKRGHNIESAQVSGLPREAAQGAVDDKRPTADRERAVGLPAAVNSANRTSALPWPGAGVIAQFSAPQPDRQKPQH